MAMTFDQRVAQIREMLVDPDLDLTMKEATELYLRWARFEFALIRLTRQERRVKKYSTWLADTTEVYNMRKFLADQ